MSSWFDPERGSLVLSRHALQALARVGSDASPELDPEVRRELAEGGILKSGHLHDRLVPLASCLSRPLARLRFERVARQASQVEGWMDERLAVLLHLPAGAVEGDVVAVPRGMVAFRLARLIELGPRPRVKVSEPVEVDEALLETLLIGGDPLTAAAVGSLLGADDEVIPEWLSVLAELARGPNDRWRVGVWWNSPEESPSGRWLEVVEGGVGSFLVTRHRRDDRRYRRVRLYPLTSTQIWRLLCALLPSDEEIVGPLTP